MQRRAYLVLGVLVLFLLALVPPAKAFEPAKWQGLFAGFQTGWAGVDDSYSDNIFGSQNLDISGWINGLVAGYNHRHNNWLFGIVVDGAIVDAGDNAVPCPAPPCQLDWNNLGTFRGRIGWIFGEQDQYAIYATGGFAVSGWDFNASTGLDHFVRHGYVVGGGLEAYLFNTNWISNAIEYNFIGFSGGSEIFAVGSVDRAVYDPDHAHVLKFILALHF